MNSVSPIFSIFSSPECQGELLFYYIFLNYYNSTAKQIDSTFQFFVGMQHQKIIELLLLFKYTAFVEPSLLYTAVWKSAAVGNQGRYPVLKCLFHCLIYWAVNNCFPLKRHTLFLAGHTIKI